jgi:outer membrane receptor for ferrienterochelin and colicins
MKRSLGMPILVGVVANGLAMPAVAQENTVHELGAVTVVSAAGFEQKITDAPASISVISQQELHSRPFTSVVDAVRELEGVDVGETRDKTGQSTIAGKITTVISTPTILAATSLIICRR